jgi:hypothetical protein
MPPVKGARKRRSGCFAAYTYPDESTAMPMGILENSGLIAGLAGPQWITLRITLLLVSAI